ncbi:Hint domain-containing protein [Pseudodonghicola flavimaris]|uniref:Hint domain-containing protein n=1 Tax=Pseudodonghicola flavimaris TaxID=3050036 RepID=A0ABT7EYP7_9RHOB|nr:Hint domain-containing protein [Pseudodonghicola flavimaris]MDK3017468.1 Hint domain-containing protein [Pseudodonghicola flavimaris]
MATTLPRALAPVPQPQPNTLEINPLLQDPAALRGARGRPQLRRYEVSALAPNGDIVDTHHIAPALPLFENAFCAFTRRTMVETDCGPVAVEDLLPGDRLITADGSAAPLLWKGSTTIQPNRPDAKGRYHRLTRVMADSFGMQMPMSDVLLGPSARILKTPGHLRALAGSNPLLTPLTEFIDGMSVIETAPPTPAQVYHLCLAEHAVIRIGGMEFETYHPGANALRMSSPAMREVFLGLFPHIREMRDFGPQTYARAGDGEIDAISA